MTQTRNENSLEFHIEPVGQQPGLWNLYTQLTFCFGLSDISCHSTINATLTAGLRRLTESFPWIAGQVVKETKDVGTEHYVIRGYKTIPEFITKDLSGKLPDFDVLRQSGFPIKFLDEDDIAPRKTKSLAEELDPKPVFLVQTTFITGGLLLTFAGQHGTMDMVGQGEVIRLLSKACHGKMFTEEELELGNRDRRKMISLLDESDIRFEEKVSKPTEAVEMPQQQQDDGHNAVRTEGTPIPFAGNVWAYFTFSSLSLQTLKQHAAESTTLESGFISTDDALSAFIWQRVSRVRLPRVQYTDTSTFARTVDVRRYLGTPSTYPGNLASKTFTTNKFQQLIEEPLGSIASQLRLSFDPKVSDLAYKTRASATAFYQNRTNEKSSKASRDLSKDIAFSSWSKVGYCYSLDFSLGLGPPEAVRRPSFAPTDEQPMEGVIYLMPKRPDGEIAAAICLRAIDMQGLRTDQEWTRYASYVG